jgi:hypothetical protein
MIAQANAETRPLGRVHLTRPARRCTLPDGRVSVFYAEYQSTAKKWQAVPAITKRCHAKWL